MADHGSEEGVLRQKLNNATVFRLREIKLCPRQIPGALFDIINFRETVARGLVWREELETRVFLEPLTEEVAKSLGEVDKLGPWMFDAFDHKLNPFPSV